MTEAIRVTEAIRGAATDRGTGQIRKIAAVVLRGGLLLVVRKRGTSLFLSPGGKPEPAEPVEGCLARELREETGLVLRDWRPWGSYTAPSALETGSTVHIAAFLVRADGVARAAREIAEVAWIDAGYRSDGLRLGSVFADHVVPELITSGLLRHRHRCPPAGRPAPTGTVLVTDLDGTLAFDGRPPGPAVSAALAELAELAEVRLVLATSRAPRGVRALLGPLADRLELLCCNGALQVRDGAVVRRHTLPADRVGALVNQLDASGLGYYLEYGDQFRVRGGGFPWMAYPDRIDLEPGREPPCQGVVKLAIEAPRPARLIGDLRPVAGPDLGLVPHTGGVLDVVPGQVTKQDAVREITDLDQRRLVVFGDDLNDQDLLGAADQAVVVGTGLPGLDRAGHVTRVPAADPAVAAALRRAAGLQPAGRTGS